LVGWLVVGLVVFQMNSANRYGICESTILDDSVRWSKNFVFFPDTWAADETGETTQTDGIANSTVQKLKELVSQY
jgi:hypothetical protein